MAPIVILLFMNGLVVVGIERANIFIQYLDFSAYVLIFVAHSFLCIALAFINIYSKYVSEEYRGLRLRAIKLSSLIFWAVIPFTNFLISTFTGSVIFSLAAPIFVIAYSVIILYSINYSGLFEIRDRAVNLLSYILSLVFSVSTVVFVNMVLSESTVFFANFDYSKNIVYLALILIVQTLVVVLVFLFSNNKLRALFYGDDYNLLESLSRVDELLLDSEDNENRAIDLIREEVISVVGLVSLSMSIGKSSSLASHITEVGSKKSELGIEHNKPDSEFVKEIKMLNEESLFIVFERKKRSKRFSEKDLVYIELAGSKAAKLLSVIRENRTYKKRNKELDLEISSKVYELRKSNEILTKLLEEKDEFISITSHQLRTPLTILKSRSSLLLKQSKDKKQAKIIEANLDVIEGMRASINELLAAAKIESGSLKPELMKVNLSKLVDESVSAMCGTGNDRIILDVQKNLYVKADPVMLKEVISNFVSNAVQYSEVKSKVNVLLGSAAKYITFEVTDNGIGISEPEKNKLFKKFYRSKKAQEIRSEGTGLGLFIAKKMIELHGGKVIFRSKLGEGSTFGFKIVRDGSDIQKKT